MYELVKNIILDCVSGKTYLLFRNAIVSLFKISPQGVWQRLAASNQFQPFPSVQKEVGKNIRDKKNDKRGRDGALSWEGNLKKKEVSKHQEALSLLNLWQALEAQRAT